ncbi:MAG: hypothetical protein VX527_12410 [Planctomycetota bacterium]|nr:hypothetical protein [Planctomycetota bacterium]
MAHKATLHTGQINGERKSGTWFWVLLSILIVILVGLGLRWGSGILEKDRTWDERYIMMPIQDLVDRGWSVDTAIDFQEAKGPAMIWPYAVWGDVIGPSLNSYRFLSVICFILTLFPLLVLALRCGLPPPTLPLVAIGLVLLPFEAVLSQLVMGEPSYVLIVACMLVVVLWGAGDRDQAASPLISRCLAPVLYGILLLILLHSRVHVVAIAGGVCLAMAWRDGARSWPWWLASIIAGLLRIPLWMRWGGLVSSDYQGMHGFGFRLESLTYLGAALAIPFAIFLLVWLWRYRRLAWWWLAPMGAFCGLLLGVVAPSDLIDPQTWGDVKSASLFLGPTRSAIIGAVGAESMQWIPLSIAAAIGLGGLGALGAMALEERDDKAIATLGRLQFFTLVCGWGLYLFTKGFVFDRFLLAWTAAMPVVWVAMLPRWAWILQTIGLAVLLAMSALTWLW